ncbi:hypothetical protein [Pantoea agglomerans]
MIPAPSVWSGFDKKALWNDICDYRNKTVLPKSVSISFSWIFSK